MKKNVLGLDLGTNSIGWALVEQDFGNKQGQILGMGSRIIPMTQDIKDEFGKGNSISQTADRAKIYDILSLCFVVVNISSSKNESKSQLPVLF